MHKNDNSGSEIELLLSIGSDSIDDNRLDESRTHHVLIAKAVAATLGIGIHSVFAAAKRDPV